MRCDATCQPGRPSHRSSSSRRVRRACSDRQDWRRPAVHLTGLGKAILVVNSGNSAPAHFSLASRRPDDVARVGTGWRTADLRKEGQVFDSRNHCKESVLVTMVSSPGWVEAVAPWEGPHLRLMRSSKSSAFFVHEWKLNPIRG